MKIWIDSAGVVGPGLPGWAAARAFLDGSQAYQGGELVLPKLEVLPPVERRRTGTLVKLALAAGQDALATSSQTAANLPTIFTASGGDGDVINEICSTLAGTERQVSPTRFHNSVHNAPAGYWSIATGSRAPSTSLSAFDWSFGAGLVEAAAQIATGRRQVLLVAYDHPYPQPLLGVRKVSLPFGCGLLVAAGRGEHTLAAVELAIAAGAPPTRMQQPLLERLREDNPAARALPLLAALARREPARILLDYVGGKSLVLSLSPC